MERHGHLATGLVGAEAKVGPTARKRGSEGFDDHYHIAIMSPAGMVALPTSAS